MSWEKPPPSILLPSREKVAAGRMRVIGFTEEATERGREGIALPGETLAAPVPKSDDPHPAVPARHHKWGSPLSRGGEGNSPRNRRMGKSCRILLDRGPDEGRRLYRRAPAGLTSIVQLIGKEASSCDSLNASSRLRSSSQPPRRSSGPKSRRSQRPRDKPRPGRLPKRISPDPSWRRPKRSSIKGSPIRGVASTAGSGFGPATVRGAGRKSSRPAGFFTPSARGAICRRRR